MPEPVPSASIRALYGATALLGDPDEAIDRLSRRRRTWILPYALFAVLVGCFTLARYPLLRTAASGAALFGAAPLVLRLTRRNEGHERLANAGAILLWTVALQNVISAAMTGGVHSPHAFALFMTFSMLYVRHGASSRRRAVVIAFCGIVLGLALEPRSWAGPVLSEPWFTIASAAILMGTFGVHTQFVATLRRGAAQGLEAALRARDELADQTLSRARELEMVGSRLSHELKNPLAAIKALVQLAHRTATEPILEKQLGVVEREVDRMSTVVQSHLGFARPFERVDRVAVDCGDLADSVLALLDGRARVAGVTLGRRGNAQATVDAQRIRGALVNLVANAIEACPQRGQVEIAIEDDGRTVRFAVTDTGAGMTPEMTARIGRPFFTTRERGSGLGVALARVAFEQHGGSLEYRSAPGQGTTAIGSLPRMPSPVHSDGRHGRSTGDSDAPGSGGDDADRVAGG
jgi:signal transduction histidine kinase